MEQSHPYRVVVSYNFQIVLLGIWNCNLRIFMKTLDTCFIALLDAMLRDVKYIPRG